ncbi:MAG TPA: type II toxin-antitoxin system death-on-curing family toxin [Planctomycetota bacterium]|nr:type II toxin-antitoxin system death-on-curing family toxin [Planctomycetota bacterium]
MKAPDFLSLADVLELHAELVERYGGSQGVRDMGLLQSALAVPRSGIAGEHFHADLSEMAAAYLYHLVKNHPFVDGNKSTGAVAALQFLWLNGVTVSAPGRAFEGLILTVAEGSAGKVEVAAFLRRHSEP